MLYKIATTILKPVFYFLYLIRIVGRENINKGAAVVCSNHSSNLDPLFLVFAFGVSNPLRFMAKKELFDVPVLGWFLRSIGTFPVNRGAADINAIKDSISILKNGGKVMMFPQGTRVEQELDTNSEPIKTGVALIAVRAGVPIIPVYAAEKKRLFKRTNIIIGKPIIPQNTQGTSSENYRRIADNILAELSELKKVSCAYE